MLLRVKNMKRLGALGILCAVFCWAPCGPGQQMKDESLHKRSAPPSQDRTLLLDVVVADKFGRPVRGLQESDFTVLDNRQPAKILSFQVHNTAELAPNAVDPTSEVILVLDEVNASYDRAIYAREGIERYLKLNNGMLVHPVSLAFFSDKGMQVQTQPVVDGDALAAALANHEQSLRNEVRGQGFYGGEDRLKLSMDALEQLIAREEKQPGKKMVIWVSPGWPLLSGPENLLSASQQQHTYDTVVRLSETMQRARMTMYSIDSLGAADAGTTRTSYYQNFTNGLTKLGDANFGDLSLQVLATQTGGRVIFGNDSIQASISHCVADLDAFYTFSLQTMPSDSGDVFHDLQVKLQDPSLKARTRIGYYARP